MIKKETWYQERFFSLVQREALLDYMEGSVFYREIPLSYSMAASSRGGHFMPNASVDFVEVDALGHLHLWEAKRLHSYELTSGRVVGQMLFYDWLFRTYEKSILRDVLSDAGLAVDSIAAFRDEADLCFDSWNVLVCGGFGYEIGVGINPVMWNYPTIHDDYFKDSVPPIAVYHFYHVNGDMRLRNIWDISLFRPMDMEYKALLAFLNSEDNTMYRFEFKDDELILSSLSPDLPVKRADQKLSFELFLKFVGRLHMAEQLGVELQLFNRDGTRKAGVTVDPNTGHVIAFS